MPFRRKTKKIELGKQLINSKNEARKSKHKNSQRHTQDLGDGYDYATFSVTEENNLQELFLTAEMNKKKFEAERENVTLIDVNKLGLLTAEEHFRLTQKQNDNKKCLRIPRRPDWDLTMEAEKLQKLEYEQFILWRQQLAEASEQKGLLFTPFEKNLEFWRQLWRVLERSDVIVQIVDARNPNAYYCEDIHTYANELHPDKTNILLLNKSDFLTEKQRQHWADYFDSKGIRAVFFSALDQIENDKAKLREERNKEHDDEEEDDEEEEEDDDDDDDEEEEEEYVEDDEEEQEKQNENVKDDNKKTEDNEEPDCEDEGLQEALPEEITAVEEFLASKKNSSRLFNRNELIALLRRSHFKLQSRYKPSYLTIGLVGYPNVGKSSTINALLECKKVSVSRTPGKTKHFQTIFLDKELCLCDCPGLVFPNFVSSKAEMVLNGILPIDQIRDHRPPVNLLASLIPVRVFKSVYSLILPSNHTASEFITSDQLLNAFALMKGFVTGRGIPDHSRSSKILIKDFVTGHLLYCYAPPSVEQKEYEPYDNCQVKFEPKHITPFQQRVLRDGVNDDQFDNLYFNRMTISGKVRGVTGITSLPNLMGVDSLKQTDSAKPWKELNKLKRNKREKLRRVYRHLDEH